MSIIDSLTPELSSVLKESSISTLEGIIKANCVTTYASEAPLLAEFRAQFEKYINADHLFHVFTSTIPFSQYADYLPYISRLFESPCLSSRITNLLAPGLPVYIGLSSVTTGGAPKTFPKYATKNVVPINENSPFFGGSTVCTMINFLCADAIKVVDDIAGDGKTRKLSMCMVSNGMTRIQTGIGFDNDEALIAHGAIPFSTSPSAVMLIKNHRTILLVHGLFALINPSLETFAIPFSTMVYDFVGYLATEWGMLVQAVEDGILPSLDGLEDLGPHIQKMLTPNPARAAELRKIDVSAEKWLKRVWPRLELISTIVGGPFSRALSRIYHDFGADIKILPPNYGTTEGFVGAGFSTDHIDLFKVWKEEFIEYLDINGPEDTKELRQVWELESGRKYEPVLTTRDGLWRYRLGDVIEVVGFNAVDGQPIIKFISRRSTTPPVSGVRFTEYELNDVINGLKGTMGNIVEFTMVLDDRQVPHSIGLMVELERGALAHDCKSVTTARSTLHALFSAASESYRASVGAGKIGMPSVRVLSPGTFGEFRRWKMQARSGNGVVKIPSVVGDDATASWMLARVEREVL